MDWRSFLYRRLSNIVTCTFQFSEQRTIKLLSKHHISSFRDVFANPFYWEALSKLDFIPKGILDIGANLGYFSILVEEFRRYKFAPTPFYILVEANPDLIPKIKSNLALFSVDKYKIIQAVAGPLEREVSFYVDKEHILSSSVHGSSSGKEYKIKSLNFEEFGNIEIDLIKIDIEGAEYDLVKNHANSLARAKCIILELHGNENQNQALMTQLTELGFSIDIYTKEHQTGFQLVSLQRVK